MENKKISVLLIEDSIDDAELIKRTLEKSVSTKFQVILARRLEDGLKQAELNEPDLIVSDLGLPDSHGLDTVTKILLAVPHLPLVVLSGFDDEDTGIKAVQSGAQDYLVKGRLDDAQLERSIHYSIERARLQHELEQNSQEISKLHVNLLKILENSTDATVVVSENGDILFTNPAVESLFGRKPKELLNQSFQYPLAGGKTSEIEINRPDSKKTIAEMNVVSIVWEGRPARLVSMHNITKRKAMEEELRASEEKYRNIVELSHEGIIITNLEGLITSCNLTFLNMIGLQQEDIVGKHFKDIPNININGLPAYIKMFASLLNGKKNPSLEMPWKIKGGDTRIFELSSNLMEADGNIFGVQTIVTDITERKQAQEALQAITSRQEAILAAVPDIIMEVDENKVYTWANNAGITFFGDDVIGKDAAFYFEGEQDTYEIVAPIFNGEESIIFVESWQRRRDGEKRLLRWWCRVLKDRDGNATGALSSARDITEIKKAEEALRISEEKFSKAFLNSPEVVIISSIDDSRIIDANNTFLRLSGYCREEVIGEKASDLGLWDIPQERNDAIKTLKEEGIVTNRECHIRIKSGELRTWLFSAEIINIDNKPCMLSVNTDITERKKMEEALKQSEERYRDLFENASDLIQSCNVAGKFVYVNKAWRDALGYSEKEILDLDFWDIVHPDYLTHCKQTLQKVISGETVINIETGFVAKDGRLIQVEGNVNPVRKEEKVIATRAIFRDISVRKEAEEKLRKIDQMKSEFLSNVSHELRTPLQSISGFTKLIMTGKVPDQATQQEFLQIIDSEVVHLGNLINSLLDMSRLESGRFQIYKKDVSIRDIIVDTMKTLHSLAREKDITLIENLPKQLPEMEADSDRLRQVILNLVGNAIKFSDRDGSIDVNVALQDGELLFQVIDHGTGIKKEAMSHLFERFYRAEGETVRGGTGLGLYISKQIIDAHGGNIRAESKYGEGSTFSFTLPLNNKGGEKNGKENSDNRRRSGNAKTGRLLTKAGRVPDNHGL